MNANTQNAQSTNVEAEKLKTGTTTVGVVCKDCVIIGADRRITAGNFVVGKEYEKVFPITDDIVLTISGVVSDVQMIVKYLRAELNLKKIRTGRKPTLKETANLLSTWNYGLLRGSYAISHFLIAGPEAIYDVTPDGALKTHDTYVASGSGSVFSYGVLETAFRKGLSQEEGVDVVVKSLNAALQRDSATGNGIDVYAITKDGAKKVLSKEINTGVTN